MRRFIILLAIGGVIAAVTWFGYLRWWEPRVSAGENTGYDLVEVERGSIDNTVSATGSIEPEAEVSLSFRTTGRVSRVLVGVGQTVQEGQLLAELDTSDQVLALQQAEASLQISTAELRKLETPPSESDIAAAQASVTVAQASVASAEAGLTNAQAGYRELVAGPAEQELAVQEAQVRQAEATMRQAQQAYDQVRSAPNVGALPQAAELEQATNSYEVAQVEFELATEPPSETEITNALSQIAQAELSVRQARSDLLTAQNNLQDLLAGPSAEDLEIARAQVRQAELSKTQAERALENARVVAPFDGVVSLVNVRQGELYSGGLPAVVLTDLDSYHMTVLVDEIDVGQVQVGQTVQLSLDALPDAGISGAVTKISPTASDAGGVVVYEVEIVPNATDAPLRAGMTATAIITTAEVDNVILVPNRYVQLDRENGRAYVQKMVNGEPVAQEIELGLRNEQVSQVIAGVREGDQVALIRRSSEDELRNAIFGN